MNDQHSLEPWTWQHATISDAKGEMVLMDEFSSDKSDPDMRRIVACVNACKGISTADIEVLPEHTLIAAVNLHKERARRLAKLQEHMSEAWARLRL